MKIKIMVDQENEDAPKNKRSRLTSQHAKPFRTLSLPYVENVIGNVQTKLVKSQSCTVTNDKNDDFFQDSIGGVIKTIKLVNFMCHSHFEIKFNPNINFIIGANGSGKSAIQTALAVGLGGTASKTNRSSKIDGLLKHGCRSGSVSITLSNMNNSFEPEKYGKEITIVRNINASTSSYKIYNHLGQLMSSKKSDLEKILLKFKIQPNNPVSILNQDMARNFLSLSRAEMKYTLFKQATQLDEVESLLCHIREELVDQEKQLELKGKAIHINEEKIKKLSEKVELMEKLKKEKRRLFLLESELMWSRANDERNELQKLLGIQNEQEDIKKETENITTCTVQEISEKENVLENLKHSMEMLQNETKSKEDQLNELKKEYQQLKKTYEEKCISYDNVVSEIRRKKADKIDLRKSLDDVEKIELEQKKKKADAVSEIMSFKNTEQDLTSQLQILTQEKSRLRTTVEFLRQKINEKEASIKDMTREIALAETNVRKTSEQSDNLLAYDSHMSQLVRMVDEAVKKKMFSKPPRGPIGRYIKVKKNEWTYAIENKLSFHFLRSFFVNNSNDQKILYQIMVQVYKSQNKPTIHKSKFQEQVRNNISEVRHPQYENMYRAISCSDTVVGNFLMDFREIHRTLLVKTNDECVAFFKNGERLPNNCKMIININADEYLPGFRVYSNADKQKQIRVLQKSVAEYVRGLKQTISEKKFTIKNEEKETMDFREDLKKNINEAQMIDSKIKDIKLEVVNLKRRMQNLKGIIDTETPSLQSRISELNDIEEELLTLESSSKKLSEEKNEIHINLNEKKKLIDTFGGTDIFAQLSEKASIVEELTGTINTLKKKLENCNKKINEQNLKIEKLVLRIQECRSRLACREDSASQYSEEPDRENLRSIQDITDDLNEAKTFIEIAENSLGSEVLSFQKLYIKELTAFQLLKKSYEELSKVHKEMINRKDLRHEAFENLRVMKSNVVYSNFQKVLQIRNYKGSLKFDHTKGKLNILLAPTDGGNTYMNTESLSGGEKSVSTVAFLMALWSTMELPFYSLDEYDVFMDALNRNAITELLVAFGRDKSNKQFIFLTPLDTSVINIGPHVQLHRIQKLNN